MSSKRNGDGGGELYQSSLFRYTKANPRKSSPVAPRKASSSFKDKTLSIPKASDLAKTGVTRIHASSSPQSVGPIPTSSFGSSSSVTSRDLKENKAPTSGTLLQFASSPIPGLSPSRDKLIAQREKRKAVERDPEEAGAQVSAPSFTKRKARSWEVEEHSGRVDGDPTKRRRRTSSSSIPASHNQPSDTNKGGSPYTPNRHDPQSTPMTPRAWSSAVTLFNDDHDAIDDASGVIQSSQSQPLLSPGRPVTSSLQDHASLSQLSDDDIVRSSQSPSPLKADSHHLTTTVAEFTLVATPLTASLYPSPLKTVPEASEASVAKRRRAPEPSTVSMFGVRGAGVSSPPELSLDIESPSTMALYSGVKLIRRPGRYSIPLSTDEKDPATPHAVLESKQMHHPRPQAQSPTILSIVPVDQASSQTPALESGGSSCNGQVEKQASDTGPFWETQPLLDFESDQPLSPSTSPPVSPSPLPRMTLPPTGTYPKETQPTNVFQAEVLADTSGSETEPDSPSPFLPPTCYIPSSVDPDKTIVAFTPTRQKRGAVLGSERSSILRRRQSGARRTVLVPGSSPADASDEWDTRKGEIDDDMTMVNHRVKTAIDPTPLKGKVQEGDIREVTLGLEGLSPFKRQKHRSTPKQMLRLQDPEVIVIEEDIDDPVGPLLIAGHHAEPQEETQDSQTYTQMWPGTSLPAGWNAFETPKKRRREPRFRVLNGSRSKLFECSNTFADGIGESEDLVQDEHDSDDVFGPEVTPRTLEREKPDELKAFEAQPSPYAGMFSGNVEGESESESEV